MRENDIAKIVLNAAFNVHKNLGLGLLESTYQVRLVYELNKVGLMVEVEAPLPVIYEEVKLDFGYRVDLWIERKSNS